jgi:hypothetical protein
MTAYSEPPAVTARRLKREREALERAALLAAMAPAERDLRYAIWRDRCGAELITPPELQRPIVVTPFDGCYGRAGVVLCIEGSPPHGAYAVMGQGEQCAVVHDLAERTRARRPIGPWGPEARQPLRRAILAYLAERGMADYGR